MGTPSDRRTVWLVFALVGAGFTTLYLPQPVLPQLRAEFGVDEARASLTVSAVILGMALSNLPFGALADRHPMRPIVLAGGGLVALSSLLAALSGSLGSLVTLRFLQGLNLDGVLFFPHQIRHATGDGEVAGVLARDSGPGDPRDGGCDRRGPGGGPG